jgi:hypothetical protein
MLIILCLICYVHVYAPLGELSEYKSVFLKLGMSIMPLQGVLQGIHDIKHGKCPYWCQWYAYEDNSEMQGGQYAFVGGFLFLRKRSKVLE